MVGRLASVVAKKLLQGYKIVVVRCEELVYSNAIHRQTRKALQFRRKRTLTNPKWGPHHQRSPTRAFQRVVRGMLPHKTARGTQALHRMKLFEGCPAPYDVKKKVVVPSALRALRLRPGRKFCKLGDVQKRVGWQYQEVVARLENARKAKAYKWFLQRQTQVKARQAAIKKAESDPSVKPFSALLKANGF